MTGVCSRFAYLETINAYKNCPPDHLTVFLMDINECIEASIGRKGQTFRIGGDEFVVFAGMTQKQVESTLLELKHTTEK